ncbi:MAG: hypothetical protein ABL967_01375 [Bryobacteraceae bacterium]
MARSRKIIKVAAILSTALCASAQEQPLRVNGTFSTGFYSSYTRDVVDQKITFVPVGSVFNITGYYMTPDLVTFSAQPELNFGPQATEAGFQGGNGIRFNTTFLRRRAFPLTFRYTNVQLEDAYFGGLAQVSTYRLKNRYKDIGVNWELRPAKLPVFHFDWDRSSSNSVSGIDLIPDAHSSGNHVKLDSKYERWGWTFGGFANRQNYQTELFSPLNLSESTYRLSQGVTQYQTDAQRGFGQSVTMHMTAGAQRTSSALFGQPFDLTTKYANANMQILPKRRWRGSMRAGYSSNLASQVLNQVLTGLGGTGPGTIAPDPTLLSTLRQNISNANVNGTTSVELAHGFGVFAQADHNQVSAVNREAGPLRSSFSTATAGVSYAKHLSWISIAGQYGRDIGNGSITGQSGTIRGQRYMLTLQHGTPDRLQLDASVHGTDQRVDNATGYTTKNFSSEGSIMRRVIGNLSGRIGGGWQTGEYRNAANAFQSDGFTGRISLEHPRLQLSASLNQGVGNALPVYNQLIAGDPTGTIFVDPLAILPSDYRGLNFSVHANPTRKLEITGTWTRSRQHLAGIVNNDFEMLNIRASYHFRQLRFDAGYVRTNQIYAFYPQTQRGRIYIRISRAAKLL